MSAETAEVKAVATENAQTFGTSRLDPGMYTLSRFGGPLAVLAFKMDGRECCFGEVYEKLRDSKIKDMPESHHPDEADKYVTEAGEVYVTGGQIELWLLRDLLELARNGIDPFGATWFPYDFDVSCDADVLHTFFVLCSGKIVDERFSFTSAHPLVLERHENPGSKIWRRGQYWDSACACYWYRKFYTETMAGQLMVLRPDEPQLYYYPEGRSKAGDRVEGQLSNIQRVLAWIRVAIWVLVALALLELALRWK